MERIRMIDDLIISNIDEEIWMENTTYIVRNYEDG